jgi:TM2 domain-containing membrane protein YozV
MRFKKQALAKIESMAATTAETPATAPKRSPVVTLVVSWLIPGAGHFMLGRRGRGVIVFVTVLISFVTGLLMRGPMFQITGVGDVLSRLIQYGGYLGDLSSGLFYFITVWAGYSAPDTAGHVPDYGAKFLVAAGLFNILTMVDAYEIATHQKD